jgi:hypothetical protein
LYWIPNKQRNFQKKLPEPRDFRIISCSVSGFRHDSGHVLLQSLLIPTRAFFLTPPPSFMATAEQRLVSTRILRFARFSQKCPLIPPGRFFTGSKDDCSQPSSQPPFRTTSSGFSLASAALSSAPNGSRLISFDGTIL